MVKSGNGFDRFMLFLLAVPLSIAVAWSLSPVLDGQEDKMMRVSFVLFIVLTARCYNTAVEKGNKLFSIKRNLAWGLVYVIVFAVANIVLFSIYRPEHQIIGLFEGQGILTISFLSLAGWAVFAPLMVILNNKTIKDRETRRLNGQLPLFEDRAL